MPIKPNVIWIVSDQHRAQALSINGDGNVNTPNLDRLALNGVNFTHAVSGFPLCCPFRGSMLTGVYPHKCVPGHMYPMPAEQKTIAHVFNENGYDTSYFGKWHLDGCSDPVTQYAPLHIVPPERRGGFKNWLAYENNNSQWNTWVHGGEGEHAFQRRLNGYETDALTDALIEYLEANAGETARKPFFAVLSVQPPHDPYLAPAEYMARFNPEDIKLRENVPNIAEVRKCAARELARYYAMVENLDHNVGRIMDCLYSNDLLGETHVMYFSDHGDMHGSHGQFRKTTPFEEAIRIPFTWVST